MDPTEHKLAWPLFKMPKKIEVVDKLPDNFVILEAVGPKKAKICANSSHVLLPFSWLDKEVYVVRGFVKAKTPDNEKCERCNGNVETVRCEKFNVTICRKCCSDCHYVSKCPNWNE